MKPLVFVLTPMPVQSLLNVSKYNLETMRCDYLEREVRVLSVTWLKRNERLGDPKEVA